MFIKSGLVAGGVWMFGIIFLFHLTSKSGPPPFKQKQTTHVCFTSDNNTLVGLVTAINSVRKHSTGLLKFHLVVEKNFVEDLRYWIQFSDLYSIDYEIIAFDGNSIKDKIKVWGGRPELGSPMNYARFYYPELLPDVSGNIIHLDDDVVVQGDVAELAQIHFDDKHMAAFSEDCSAIWKRFTKNKYYRDFLNFNHDAIKQLNMKETACSFNTGVYVTNLNLWRKHDITSQLEHWMRFNTKEKIYGNDIGGGGSQPPMLIVFYDKYIPLDLKWHTRFLGGDHQARFSNQFIEEAKLLHWNGKNKPWFGLGQYVNTWRRYYVPDPSRKYILVKKSRDYVDKA